MNQGQFPLKNFQPDVYIEIDDVVSGERKLGRVDETGLAYFDLSGRDATAFPIYEHLNPEEAGNILGWGLYLTDHHPEEQPKFRHLVDRLMAADVDVLTYNRAALWAFREHDFDFDRALAAGVEATKRVQASRAKMDATIRRAEGVAP